MLYQYDTVAEERIANPFPINQVGTIIGRLQYGFGFSGQARGVCPLYEDGYFHIITSCINEKNKKAPYCWYNKKK